jgi:hypothetical protein
MNIILGPGSTTFRPSFCDIRLAFTGMPSTPDHGTSGIPGWSASTLFDVRRLAYNDRQGLRFHWGCANTPLARVGRVTQATGEIELGIETFTSVAQAFNQLVKAGVLFGGFGDVSFDLAVTYQLRPGDAFIKDVLENCRFEGAAEHHQSNGKSLTNHQILSIARIAWGGAHLTSRGTAGVVTGVAG